DAAVRLVGLRLAPLRLVPVDRQLGQDLKRRALARAAADFLEIEPASAEQLAGDVVAGPLRPLPHRALVLMLAALVQDLSGQRAKQRRRRDRFGAPVDAGNIAEEGRLRVEAVAAAADDHRRVPRLPE